jgi:hypothetical protein
MIKLSKKFLLLTFIGLSLLNSGLSLALLGWSPVRSDKLALVLTGVCLAFIFVLFILMRSEKTANFWTNILNKFTERVALYNTCLIFCGIIFLAGWLYLFLPADLKRDTLNLYIVFRPLVIWSLVTAILLFGILRLWQQSELIWGEIDKRSLKYGALALLVFLVLWGYINYTRLGLEPIGNYWYAPGTPLLVTQVIGALLLGLLYLFFESKYAQPIDSSRMKIDLIIGLLIWLLASSIWLSQPLSQPTQFSPSPVPPNNVVYPFSDAASYDLNAQRFLIGEGLSLNPQYKPLYAFYLALLHIFAGQDYTQIIKIQVILLSFIPIILYILIGKIYSNRTAGLIAAVLFILREKNSIALSNIIQVSHSKLLLTDLPATGLMVLLIAFLVGWVMKPHSRQTWPLWVGCIFGLFLLLRTQGLILAPFILISAYAIRHHQGKIIKGLLLITAGVILIMLPWGVYGYWSSSAVKSPGYIRQLAFQIQADTPEEIKPLVGETNEEFDARLQKQIFEFVKENPGQLTQSIFSYFLHNVVQSVAYFPQSMQLESDIVSYAKRMPFWKNWTGNLPVESRGMLLINLVFIAFGIGILFARYRFAGLIPILIYIGYITSLALPMVSGWRFLMPADWILLMYFSIGLGGVFVLFQSLFWGNYKIEPFIHVAQDAGNFPFPWQKILITALTIVLFGATMPIFYWSIPKMYPPKTTSELMDVYEKKREYSNLVNLPGVKETSEFLGQKDVVGLYGRALYPRYFPAGKGLRDGSLQSFKARDFARLGFDLIGPDGESIVLPLQSPPKNFPQGSDVWIIGCERNANTVFQKYIEAWLIIVHVENTDIFLLRSPWAPMDCDTSGKKQ